MPRRKTSIDCNHLINFKHNLSPDLESSSTTRKNPSNHYHRRHKPKKYDPNKEAAQRAENWMRQKLHSSFYLHSSALHSFVVTRSKVDKQKGEDKPRYLRNPSGGGGKDKRNNHADCVVDWDTVKIVKVLAPTPDSSFDGSQISTQIQDGNDHTSTCALCLDTYVSPRITKCGHVYCFPCILRHFYVCDNDQRISDKSHANSMQYHRPRDSVAKCPCCFSYIQLSEIRPVQIVTIQSPKSRVGAGSNNNNNMSMTFQKCHRKRDCMVPFLPFQTNPTQNHQQQQPVSIRKRIDSNDLPNIYDSDAPFCRFNYLDMSMYIQHLQNDLSSLQLEMQSITEMYNNFKGQGVGSGDLDRYFITMAIEAVQVEHRSASTHVDEQTSLKKEQEIKYSSMNRIQVVPYSASSKLSCCNDASVEDDNELTKKKSSYRPRSNSMHLEPGTMYLDDDCVHFYQAADGQLSFLCSFNLKCLAHEFMDREQESTAMQSQISTDKSGGQHDNHDADFMKPPFPDIIQGQIIDVQSVHITPEIRNRMAFTSHLPLYIDINLVELNLTQYLSHRTREHFKHEFEQRKKKRQSLRNAEKRAKKMAEKEEFERIENLKRGIQTIDVNDEFFYPIRSSNEEEKDFVGEAFGPSLSSSRQEVPQSPNEVSSNNTNINNVHRSYGSVCASNGFFPTLDSSNNEAFPSLSTSTSTSNPTHVKIKNEGNKNVSPNIHKDPSTPQSKKKSKVVLFSTGGRRGYSK